MEDKGKLLEIESDAHWVRLEVDGHYMGKVDIVSGVFCLYWRGHQEWFDLAELREKANQK